MKKDIKFSTRMASADREAIKELAKRSGMSMSDYVTACCLGKQVVVIDGLKEVLKELKYIGRNLCILPRKTVKEKSRTKMKCSLLNRQVKEEKLVI